MAGPATNGKVHFDSRPSELVRVATAGSVDDGKSTLVGRLLHDSKAILADQLEQVARTSTRMSARSAVDAPVTMLRVYCAWTGVSAMMKRRRAVANGR